MSQKLLPISPLQLLLLQCLLIGFSAAYPYLIVPNAAATASGDSRRLVKRAFDRFDNSGVFSFGAKRFDRYDEENPYGYVLDSHIFKRSVPAFVSIPSKKAFDRMDHSDFFGAKRKRSFDRIGGTEFGLMKRAGAPREQLIDNLAESIIALRRAARETEGGSQPVLINYED
uniref:Uncharacterized protein n=1 Tax=Caenorhabditis tropicalis TaxID=1561998 RepID=A0A1I7T938_9PELO